MSKRVYNKTPLSFTDQLALLKSRGISVTDEHKAISFLQEISYYRLSAYFSPYQSVKDTFNPGTTFKQIIDTYSFDSELRLLVFDCIERIASFFDLHPTVFISWLHSLTYVRNICAHHARLWNKELAIKPELLLNPTGDWISIPFNNNKRLFYFLCVLKYLLLRANPGNNLKVKLETLFAKYLTVPIKYLGIPTDGTGNMLNWQDEPLWQN